MYTVRHKSEVHALVHIGTSIACIHNNILIVTVCFMSLRVEVFIRATKKIEFRSPA